MARRATRWALLSCVVLAGAACSTGGSKPCGSGQVQCGGCYDPAHFQTDPYNCGGCGIACGAGATCAAGVCQCAAGQTRCDALSPRCRDVDTDAHACGLSCTDCSAGKPGATCQGGVCGCFANPDDCTTFCTNTQTDPANCAGQGGCGHPCPLANEACSSGVCGCPPSLPTQCPAASPTACVNTTNDRANCGGCGTPCPLTNEICSNSACQCPMSLPDQCPGACVSRATDPQNCGACGNACPAGATCTSGICQCPADTISCGNVCTPCLGGSCVAGACHCQAGPPSGCNGRCCAGGDTCCGNGSCQTQHSNGLGQSYFDCNFLYAPNQTTAQAASAAADAWPPGVGGTPIAGACQTFCIGRQTAAATQCAVWCYAGSTFAGLVGLNTSNGACLCPGVASQTQTWN